MLNNFNTIIAECKFGQPIDGVQYGGQYIVNAFKLDVCDIIQDRYFNGVDNSSKNGYHMLSKSIINYHTNGKTLLLGGDHSVGISSLDAMLNIYGDDLRVLWIDAHADINDYNSSMTGNIHGMPLGFHFIGTNNNIPWRCVQNRLKPHQLCYYGIRDLDEFEKNLIEEYNIKYYNNINDIKLFMKSAPKLMISFDVDSIDPLYIDATGTKVDNGININDVNNIMHYGIENCNLIHLDITELNPMIGDINKSIDNLKKCFV
jgi:arginase